MNYLIYFIFQLNELIMEGVRRILWGPSIIYKIATVIKVIVIGNSLNSIVH